VAAYDIPHARHSAAAARNSRHLRSFRDYVDAALFHPQWGYYSSGAVRFGIGGHYDTYPLALSPIFGRMLAQYAFNLWRRQGCPNEFELCELGAGNGQLCLDTLLWVIQRATRERAWRRFESALRYLIVERSRALSERQRRVLGPVGARVRWKCLDLSRTIPRTAPWGSCGLIFGNEVLDCLPHHKIVRGSNGEMRVTFVAPGIRLQGDRRGTSHRPISWERLAQHMAAPPPRPDLVFEEVAEPLTKVRGLAPFLRRNYPEIAARASSSACFVSPEIERIVEATAKLYERGEVLWIDYGGQRTDIRDLPVHRRVFAGPPRSEHGVYDSPGRDDITFLVDFTLVREAARRNGLTCSYFGPQSELARRSGIAFDRRAVDLVVRTRALGWMLSVIGADSQDWQRTGLSWGDSPATPTSLRRYVRRSFNEFLGRYSTPFKLMILRHSGRTSVRAGRG
jgi:SAM-dependent MidA family methyltransferase